MITKFSGTVRNSREHFFAGILLSKVMSNNNAKCKKREPIVYLRSKPLLKKSCTPYIMAQLSGSALAVFESLQKNLAGVGRIPLYREEKTHANNMEVKKLWRDKGKANPRLLSPLLF